METWDFETACGIFQPCTVSKAEKVALVKVAPEIYIFLYLLHIYIRHRLPTDVFIPFRMCFYS